MTVFCVVERESEEINGQGRARLSKGEGDTEPGFLFAAVISQEQRGSCIPSSCFAENGILLNR